MRGCRDLNRRNKVLGCVIQGRDQGPAPSDRESEGVPEDILVTLFASEFSPLRWHRAPWQKCAGNKFWQLRFGAGTPLDTAWKAAL